MVSCLVPADEQVLKAMINLRQSGSMDYQKLREWLDASHQEALKTFTKIGEEKELTNFAGYVRCIEEILGALDSASKDLDKIRR